MSRTDQENRPLTTDDERDLAAAFAAARADEVVPSAALLAAILADAATVTASREAAPVALRSWVSQQSGRWRAAVALAAAAAVGFWIGIAGNLEAVDPSVWTGATLAESDADPVAGFFDLASVEN